MERLIDFWKEAGGFVAGNQKLLAEIVWSLFCANQILLLLVIFSYCAMHEFIRVLGAEKVGQMFFGPLLKP